MALISWGKPRIFVIDKDADGSPVAYEIATPVEDSTELTPTKGDKMEAKIEGGENEDVKYKRSTYAVTYNIRKKKGRKIPFKVEDGLVDHHWGIALQPEDPECEGFVIDSSTVSVDDTFTAADGAIWAIQHDAVKAAEGDTVKWGMVEVDEVNHKIKFLERSSNEGEQAQRPTELWDLAQDSSLYK